VRGRLHSIQISDGGVPKLPVESAVVRFDGVSGDRQADRRYHGGPDRAVSLFSREVIEHLRAEGHPIAPGTTGENLTIAGLPWERVLPHAFLGIGSRVLLEVSEHVKPCKTIAASFREGRFDRIAPRKHPTETRMYARVIREGEVRTGDLVELLPERSRFARGAWNMIRALRSSSGR
jgi:MOSC domain-containing protein YiiM